MPLSRRTFLKTSIIAAGDAALPTLPALAALPLAPAASAPQHPGAVPPHDGFTRGLGIYPGVPADVFSPTLVPDSTYRNLALRRPATHSSSYDYNLTAQLVTDGIIDTHLPSWVAVTSSTDGVLPKPDREIILDHFPPVGITLTGRQVSAEIHIAGGLVAPTVDTIAVFVTMHNAVPPSGMHFSISVSDDGHSWEQLATSSNPTRLSRDGYPPDRTSGSQLYYPSMKLQRPSQSRFYKIACEFIGDHPSVSWDLGQVEFYSAGHRVDIGGPYDFTSAWMSASSGEEWVAVDLGARCEFDRVALHWIARAAEGRLQTSDDNRTWTDLKPDLHTLNNRTGAVKESQLDDIHLAHPAHARYLRVLMTRPSSPIGYILSELEVYGRGGPVAHPAPASTPRPDGRGGQIIDLAGGAWRVERASEIARSSQITADGPALSRPGVNDSTWVVATVPGTVLTSFYNAGALPDPNFGQNQLYISDSYFCSDFWYRTEFDSPTTSPGQIQWLNFDGINWKADIFLNGEKLGPSAGDPSNADGPSISGGFMRGRFDVTGKLLPGKRNALAVLIHKNATPGSTKQKTFETPGRNGGALGADNPTYHASLGWDWIPTIRGRDIGIWGNVSLSTTGAVTLDAPFVSSKLPLPDTSSADLALEVDLVNHRAQEISGTLHLRFGDIEVSHPVTLPASSTTTVHLDSTQYPQLHHKNPQLWWPTGYGEPHLYDIELTLLTLEKSVLDSKSFKHGIRNMAYNDANGKLAIFVNGRRFVCRGGNWGFAESMLRYRAREYDAAVRYHREMNFTMIRNWVGQVGDEAFYEACDRHGVMVWQDFWLANPWDGPDPDNDAMFMANARDLLLRIRNHASMGLYCGRNEGFPPPPIESGLRAAIAQLHPGLHYIPSSADDVVSGHGPYHALPPVEYFRLADPKLHSEIGMPNIPPLESVRLMLPESAMWPQGLQWGLHDFCLGGAMEGQSFRSMIDVSFGGANNAEEWIALAQFINYEGYRAMFEAQSKYRAGLLLWMSHCCWPSFVWQTYDYYFDPTSAYFGCKLACEPLHIQWNRSNDTIEVVNYSAGNHTHLTATLDLLNMDGSRIASKTATLDSHEDSTTVAFPITYPAGLSPVHFLRLTLSQGAQTLSANTYTRALLEGDLRAIRTLAKARVTATTTVTRKDALWRLTTNLQNTSAWPALMTRLKAVRATSGDRILPAIYSDNYLTLMPGERRSITTEFQHADTRGEQPKLIVEGFNVV